nr:hypothetical protein [Tanacetum cinerariifolium]
MTLKAIEKLIAHRVAQALANYEATRVADALEVKSQSQNGNDDDNRNGVNGNGNHEDGGNNRNGNPNENGRGAMPVARISYEVDDESVLSKEQDTENRNYIVVGFKGLHGITTTKLVLLVYKVAAVFNKVNAAKSRVTTAVRVSTAGWIKWLEDQVEQPYEPNTVEEKLDRKNEMKARGTLLMALPNKDQLKFHSYQDVKLLMEAIEKRGREYGRKTVPVENLTENALIAQDRIGGYDWSYQAEEERPTNFTLMALTSSGSSSNLESENLEKVEKERDELKLTLEKYQNSSKSLNTMLESQENVMYRSDKGYHAFHLPYTRTYIPPKPDLMFIDEQVESEYVDVVSTDSSSAVKIVESKVKSVDIKNKGVYSTVETKPVRKNNFGPLIIEDWNFNDESEVEFKPKVEVKTVRPSIEKINFVKSVMEKEEKKEYKKKGVIDSGCSRHMTRNKCYLTDYEDYDGGFVSFGDGKGRISGKGKIKTGSLDFDMCTSKNGVAERKNKTLIKAARTMLVDFKLPTTFWAEAVNTACYVLNKALVIKPHNKTPYELIHGRPLLIDFMKPFGCPVTILNTKDYLGKFDEKVDEGFFVGYSMVSKAMRVFNKRTKIVKETLNIIFLRNAPNVKGNRPDRLFDIDSLTISMDYVLVVAGFQTNGIAGTKDNIVAGQDEKKKEPEQEYILIPIYNGEQDDQVTRSEFEGILQQERKTEHINITNSFNTVSSHANTIGPSFVNAASPSPINAAGTPANDTGIFDNAYDDEAVEEEVDINNVDSSYIIPDAPLTKFLKDHPKDQTLVDLPKDKWAIGTKWVFRNKKDERGIVIKNKARLVAQGHTQEEGIDYDEVFTPIVRIEAIKLFLAYASFKDFVVYQMNVKSAFLYGKIKEETASTPIELNKALVKDVEDVDVHLYRSMIGSLMYLTTSRPDITFIVYAYARFQVTPKTSHRHAVKRIISYLKGQPKLGLWYPKDSPFDLEAYSDSNYARASLNRKSTTGGCHFLGKRLILWQCKKQTIVANSTTKAEYCWVILCINSLYLNTVSFGVDAAGDFKKNMLSV